MARKTTVCTLVPDPLLFAALAVAAQRAQAASTPVSGARLRSARESGRTGVHPVHPAMAYFTLGIATGQLEYDVAG